MNNDKIQKALTTLQEAFSEMGDTTTLKLELTAQEVVTLKAICWANTSVPNAVVRLCPPYYYGDGTATKDEIKALLAKIKDAL